MKRWLALAIVLVMILNLGISVLAGNDGKITVSVGAGNGSVSGGGESFEYPEDEESSVDYTITATPDENFQFEKWVLDSGNEYRGEQFRSLPITLRKANHDRGATAYFTPIATQYTISVSANPFAGGTVSGAGKYNEGAKAILTATANDGYIFTGWSDGSTDSSREITVNTDTTFTANFSIREYTITAVADPAEGGTISYPNSFKHEYSTSEFASFTANPNVNESYEFIGWYYGSNLLTTDLTVTRYFTENWSLTAKFSKSASSSGTEPVDPAPVTDSVIIQTPVFPAGAGTVTGGGQVTKGTIVTLAATATPGSGYVFDRWSMGDVYSTSNPWSFTAEASGTVYANFKPASIPTKYSITYKPGDYSSGATTSVTDLYPGWNSLFGQYYVRTGYSQTGWSLLPSGATKDYALNGTIDLKSNVTLYPYWTYVSNPLYLTVRMSGNGSVYLGGSRVYDGWVGKLEPGQSFTFTFYPENNYYVYSILLGGWYRTVQYGNQYTVTYDMMQARNQTMTVRFSSIYDSPKTGDDANVALWIALGGLSAVALGALLFMSKKKK